MSLPSQRTILQCATVVFFRLVWVTFVLWNNVGTLAAAADAVAGVTAVQTRPVHPILIRNDHGPLRRVVIQVDANASASVTAFEFSLEATDDLTDLESLQLFATGDKDGFSPSKPLGEPQAPARTLRFVVDQPLSAGKHVFWLSARLKPNADLQHQVAAHCTAVVTKSGVVKPRDLSPGVRQRIGVALRRHNDDGVHTYRIPAFTASAKGTLLAVYDMRRQQGRDLQGDIDIGLSRSTDGGRTWEPVRVIMDMGEYGGLPQSENGCSDPGIIVDRQTGTIFCFALWMNGKPGKHQWNDDGSEPGFEIGKTAQFMMVKSTDDGVTWSKPENLTRKLKQESWWLLAPAPQSGFQLADGTLVMPAQGRTGRERLETFATLLISRDHGATWTVGQPGYRGGNECQAAQLGDGSIMLNIRNDHERFRAVVVTNDLGQTWQPHATSRTTLIEPNCNGSLLRVDYEQGGEKKHVLLFANPHTQKGRSHHTVQVSFDDGKTWPDSHHWLLDEGAGAGYPSMTRIDEEHVGIVYEGSQSQLTFEKLAIVDLLEPTRRWADPSIWKRQVSPEGKTLLDNWNKGTPFGANQFDLEGLRRGMGARAEPNLPGVKLTKVQVGDIPCEWVVAPGADPDVRLLYLHGGGWVSGSGGGYLPLAAAISAAAHCAVLLPDYRLAPEHRFPAGLNDCVAAYEWMLANGPQGPMAARATFVAGDSAGGNLTLATVLAIRDRKLSPPAGAIAISPGTDFTLSSPAFSRVHDPVISSKTMPEFRSRYIDEKDWRNPLASPAFGDYHGVSPILIQTGEHEMLRDDSILAAKKARADGVPVQLEIWPGMVHVFPIRGLPESREAVERMAAFMRAQQPAAAGELRVMSFNIRYGTAKDGINHWDLRKEFLASTIRRFDPDLLGTQETLASQRDFLAAKFPEFDHAGVGRDDGREAGEMAALFYRRDRFERIAAGHFWLSETPEKVGSKSWDSALPRIVTWVKLRDLRRPAAPPIAYFNTHFDHQGVTARLESARLLRRQISLLGKDCSIIVTGDFNADEGSPPYATLFDPAAEPAGTRLRDTFRVAQPQRGEHEGTFSSFVASTTRGARIDWIGVSSEWTVVDGAIDHTSNAGRTPSDHFPVTAIVK